ncbi:MAG: histidine triad nucleotide-binding protein [Roseburia sp.]|nr:histidine triad nucleotide-binding protein [Roseburia sp.]
MENCIFCKIIAGEIPSAKVYEDDEMLIFKDIAPIAAIHFLCVPKEHFAYLTELNEARAALLGRMLQKIALLKSTLGLADGYRLVINQGENAGQTVHHLHIHILGGELLPWE